MTDEEQKKATEAAEKIVEMLDADELNQFLATPFTGTNEYAFQKGVEYGGSQAAFAGFVAGSAAERARSAKLLAAWRAYNEESDDVDIMLSFADLKDAFAKYEAESD